MDADPSVSPADTIRRAREHAGYDDMPESLREPFLALCDLADVLLAVGERDKAEIEALRGELAVAYGGPDRDGKQREWFSALDRAKAEAEDLREAGERDGRRIARLTEALTELCVWQPHSETVLAGMHRQKRAAIAAARAVLAGEEDAPPKFTVSKTYADALRAPAGEQDAPLYDFAAPPSCGVDHEHDSSCFKRRPADEEDAG